MITRLPLLIGLLIPLISLAGCLIPSHEAMRGSESAATEGDGRTQGESPSPDQPLIKPMIPPEEPLPAPARPIRQEAGPSASGPTPPATRPQAPEKSDWEDQRVKRVAMELAGSMPAIVRIKICYLTKEDEWWLVLYEDAGALLDLKQYVWNRQQERWEPHLVQKRIAKSRLSEDLGDAPQGWACEVVEPRKEDRPKSPLPVQ
jgi:hypothetical protein